MAELEFRDLYFEDAGDRVKVTFLRIFYTYFDKKAIEKIAPFSINENKITFHRISPQAAERKFNRLLLQAFGSLKNSITGKKTIYVHQNSGIPLIGSLNFGIIDRNTNIIEVRPITSCNLNCIFCSVDQNKRNVDFVVEKDYIINEIKKLIEFKGDNDIEVHIGAQGEPLLYADLTDLIRDLRKIKQVKRVSIDTNATLLTKKKIDELVDSGLTQFNVSVNALNEKIANKIADAPYSIKKVTETCRYIAKKSDLVIASIWLHGINEDEMPKLIKFAKELQNKNHKIILGIQNFLRYRFGRNPVKQMSWDLFKKKLEALENKSGMRLILDFKNDFKVHETKNLPKPFKKGQILEAEIVCPGHLRNEMIAVADSRTIAVVNPSKKKGRIKLKITRTKHNIFYGI
ncbi:radical SAM protein [Candidatus Woesearchaeota archaeon]|nr:radical SAM protein [Candidatus Woesearchaeota archaeon]